MIAVAGTGTFGLRVAESLGWGLAYVLTPPKGTLYSWAVQTGAPVATSQESAPPCSLIVAAHSHFYLSAAYRATAVHGAVGYHPSLLPLHRGRDAVRWAIRYGERVTGGTVYALDDGVDTGPVLAQRHVLIRPGDTARSLWRRDLLPLGVELLSGVVSTLTATGSLPEAVPQDEELATWEPSLNPAPLYRPGLIGLPSPS